MRLFGMLTALVALCCIVIIPVPFAVGKVNNMEKSMSNFSDCIFWVALTDLAAISSGAGLVVEREAGVAGSVGLDPDREESAGEGDIDGEGLADRPAGFSGGEASPQPVRRTHNADIKAINSTRTRPVFNIDSSFDINQTISMLC